MDMVFIEFKHLSSITIAPIFLTFENSKVNIRYSRQCGVNELALKI